jgi:hypothetical protein
MYRRIITLLLIFVTGAAPIFAEKRPLSLSFGAAGGGAFTKDERFPMKPQWDINLGAAADLPIGQTLSLGLGLAFHNTAASSLEGGFLYRGHSGIDSRLYLTAAHLPPAFRLDYFHVDSGISAGFLARYDKYELTTLYFFYPGIFLQPFLEFSKAGRLSLIVSLPLDYYFRRDLKLSLSAGLGLSLRWYML